MNKCEQLVLELATLDKITHAEWVELIKKYINNKLIISILTKIKPLISYPKLTYYALYNSNTKIFDMNTVATTKKGCRNLIFKLYDKKERFKWRYEIKELPKSKHPKD